MKHAYGTDLAYIHETAFNFAADAAPGVLQLLRRSGATSGRVVDLGCGGGTLARALTRAGYDVLGIDISFAMIALARKRAPLARFLCGSLFSAELPPCIAVVSLGECFNYTFDPGNSPGALRKMFRRVYAALRPGGVFVFDVAEPGRGGAVPVRRWWQGGDWVLLAETSEKSDVLTRRMTVFRLIGRTYRRSDETHVVRLYRREDINSELQRAGFTVRVMRRYGELRLRKSHVAFIARKP